MKKISKSLCLVLFPFVFAGCSWQIPQSVTVKQQADYNISIGKVDKSLISYDELMAEITSGISSQGINAYDYNPNQNSENTAQLMIGMNLFEESFDFSDSFGEMDISKTLDSMSFSQEFSTPDISFDFEKDIDIDVVKTAVNASVTFVTPSSGGDVTFFDVDGVSPFDSIEYESGFINAVCELMPDGTKMYLISKGDLIASGTFANGSAILQLKNTTIFRNGTSVSFEAKDAEIPVASVNCYVDSSSQIRKAAGINLAKTSPVNLENEIKGDNTTVGFEYCIVDTGKLGVDVALPAAWSGVNIDYSVTFEGALNCSTPATTSTAKDINLAQKKITKGDTKVNTEATFSLTNGILDFSDSPKIRVVSYLEKIKSVSFEIQDVVTDINSAEKLPADFTKYVREVQFKKPGLKIEYDNKLPPGNNLTINVSSDFFDIQNKSGVIESGTEGVTPIVSDSLEVTRRISSETAADFYAKLILPGVDPENPNLITLNNIEPNQVYKISLKIVPDMNWNYVKVVDDSLSMQDTIDTGIKFADLMADSQLNDFITNFHLKNIEMYLYADFPEEIHAGNLNLDLNAYLGTSDASGTITRLEGEKAISLIENVDASFMPAKYPELEYAENGKTVISDLSTFDNTCHTRKLTEIGNASLDNADANIIIDYNVGFGESDGSGGNEVIIYNTADDITQMKTAVSVSVKAIVVIPLSFEVSGKAKIDLAELINPEGGDLLGRADSDFTDLSEDMENIISSVKSVKLSYSTNQMPLDIYPSNLVTLNLNLYGDDEPFNVQSLSFDKGSIKIKSDIVKHLLSKPFTPSIWIDIGQENEITVISLPRRDIAVNMNIDLEIETNANIRLPLPTGNM